MDITGRIIAVLPERSGVSQRSGSEWKVASYVLETQEQYPKKICFEVFGTDRIQQLNIQAGEMLTVSFDIDAREYNGRWYNQIRAFRVDRNVQGQAPEATPMPDSAPLPTNATPFVESPAPEATPFGAESDEGELPF